MHPLTFFVFAAVLPTVWLMDRKALDNFVNLPDPHYEYTLLKSTIVFHQLPMDLITINMSSQKWLNAGLATVWLMDRKALDDFVNLPDPHYKYTLKQKKAVYLPHHTDLITINMTSQKWLDESEVDNPVWSHRLRIAVPAKMNLINSCLLIITSGKNDYSKPFTFIDMIVPAMYLKMTVAMLRPLPSKPLTFYNHPLGHKNSTGLDIFAYSWWRFINDPAASPHWLVQFPMVKAAVRAMDTIRDYVKKKYHVDITRFTLAGISMGGWIAWLTAAVDQRVEATEHVAMDFLNFTESFHHQYRAYCGWSYMLRPFYEMNITRELNNPRFSELASHVDPLAYNERYTNISKLIIVLTGDELFQPDNTRNYFSQLEGTKYLQVIPNHDYGIYDGHGLMDEIGPFFNYVAKKTGRLPIVSWEIIMTNTSATITFCTNNAVDIYSYHADTVGGNRRDFRMKIAAGNSTRKNPVKWIQTEVTKVKTDVYMKEMLKPEEGWRGFFIEATYVGGFLDQQHFKATSEIIILPDTFPCSDCSGDGCHGTLV